jgi:hypothetical protein
MWQHMQQMMDGGMMWGDLGGLIGLILLVDNCCVRRIRFP